MNKFKSIALAVAAVVVSVVGYNVLTGDTLRAESRECSRNSIIRCGAMSSDELKSKYAQNAGNVKGIYSHYNISAADIAGSRGVRTGYVNTNGTVTVDGKVVATSAQTVGRKKALGGSAVNAGGTTVYQGSNRLKSRLSAYVFTNADGTYKAAIIKVCGNPVPAVPVQPPKPPVPPKPVAKYACNALSAQKISRTEYKFTTNASAENATIKNYTYDFGDGSSQTSGATINHNYAKEGTYTVKVTVNMSDGKTTTSANCETKVTVSPEPVKETPAIDITKTVNNLEHVKVAVNEQFTYQIVVKNTGNVTLKSAAVTDKAPAEVTLLSASEGTVSGNTWTYTIPELKVGESKSFTITAKYAKYASGTHKNTVCVDTPTVQGSPDDCDDATTETSEEPIKVCDLTDNTIKTIEKKDFDESRMTTDESKCGEIKVCVIASKETKTIAKNDFDSNTMTTDFSKCAETPVTPVTPTTPAAPVELPHTGMAENVASVIGVGSLVGVGAAYMASRRNLS